MQIKLVVVVVPSAEIIQDSDDGEGRDAACTVNFDQSLPTRHQVSTILESLKNKNI